MLSNKIYSIALHGGAGNVNRAVFTSEKESVYNNAMASALEVGEQILKSGGSSLNAVMAVVTYLEDCPLFNAGKGSVLNAEGRCEMDAAVMCGKMLKAGAVAGVYGVKNPALLARAVMEKSEHVLLTGGGAVEFAITQNIAIEEETYFMDALRFGQWQAAKAKSGIVLDHTDLGDKKFGTVGAVALDVHGNLAAATSTGGMTNKMKGRVGDTPIVGAGTYANNNSCAVSCTGHGEHFICNVVAFDIHCLMEYKGFTLQQACEELVYNKLKQIGAEGGLIAVDALGNVSMPFNTNYMFCVSAHGEFQN